MKSLRKLASGNTPEERATRRIVMALSISAFAEWGGASSVLPLLPVYLRHKGSSVALIGVTMAAFFAAAVVVQYPLGRLSDRVGRRTIQIAGLITYAVGSVLFAFISVPLAALGYWRLEQRRRARDLGGLRLLQRPAPCKVPVPASSMSRTPPPSARSSPSTSVGVPTAPFTGRGPWGWPSARF